MKRKPSEKATYDYGKVFILEKLLVSSQVEPDPKCEKFICSVNETDNEYKVYQKAKETERKTLYQQPEWHVMSVPDSEIQTQAQWYVSGRRAVVPSMSGSGNARITVRSYGVEIWMRPKLPCIGPTLSLLRSAGQ